MSTALEKGCDWSLGFDGRGPVIDEINKDRRHSIFLTGRAARKEVYFASESPENQRLLLGAHLHHLGKYSGARVSAKITPNTYALHDIRGDDWVSARRAREKTLGLLVPLER